MRRALFGVNTSEQITDNQRRELETVVARHGWSVAVVRCEIDVVAGWSVDRLGRSLGRRSRASYNKRSLIALLPDQARTELRRTLESIASLWPGTPRIASSPAS